MPKRPKSTITISDEQRAQVIEAIAQACTEPVPEIVPINELLCTDGQYHRPFGIPDNVIPVEPVQRRTIGFAYRNSLGVTFGTRGQTREELEDRWKAQHHAQADLLRKKMTKASVRRLIEVSNYWLKDRSPWWGVTP